MRRTLSSSLLIALFAAGPLCAAATDPSGEGSWTVLDQRPAAGEQCLVCRQAIHDGDIVELRYKGRRFHVADKMMADFESDPESYFSDIELHSALFDESAMDAPSMASGWLLFGLWVLVSLTTGALCAYLAIGRGKPPVVWFFAGLLLNVVGVVAVLASGRGETSRLVGGAPDGLTKIPSTHAPRRCPGCGATNHPAARRCSACATNLEPSIQAETAKV